MSTLRLTLVALLVVSTALFAAGAITERSRTGEHTEPATAQAHESEARETVAERPPGPADSGERESLLGVDVESTPLILLAVIAGLALVALVAAPLGRRPAVLLAIAATAIAWAALDVREAVHQIDESRTGIAMLAIGVAALHLAAAAVAARLAARERANVASPSRPGTMPA